jgi:hypothetical protein
MGKTYSVHGIDKSFKHSFSWTTLREHFEDVGIDAKIVLRLK